MAKVQCPKCGTATEFPADACESCETSLEGLVGAPDNASEDELAAAARASADAAAVAAAGAAAQVGGLSGGGAREKRARRSNSALEALLPVATALLLSLALQFAIANVVGADTYIYRLFRPPGGWVMSLVPGLIVFVLVWTLTDLALKHRQGGANEADLDRREVRELPRLVSQEPVGVLQRRLLGLAGRERPVARRLLWLLHYLESNADPQRTHELLRHQSDLDADTAAAGYRTVKLFIWAMPILGFVGTVLGISLAVGGFSEFLTTNLDIEDVSRVTAELGNVASGLSFAFDTTLLGLLAGLVANVTSSAVQKRDERFFTRLDELGLSIVANRQDAGMTSPEKGASPVLASGPEFEQAMRARIDEIDGLVDRTRRVMQGLSETSARVNAGLNQSMESVRRTVDELSGNLSAVSTALEADSANQASIQEAIERLSDSLGSFGEGLAELRAEQQALGPVLEQLAGPLELRLVPGRPVPDED